MDFSNLLLFLRDLELESKRSLVIFADLQKEHKVLGLHADTLFQNDQQKGGTLQVSVHSLKIQNRTSQEALQSFQSQLTLSKQILDRASELFKSYKNVHQRLSSQVTAATSKTTDLYNRAQNAKTQAEVDYHNAKDTRRSLEYQIDRINGQIQDSQRSQSNIQDDIRRVNRRLNNLQEGDNGRALTNRLRELQRQLSIEQQNESRLCQELERTSRKLEDALVHEAECQEELRLCTEELNYQHQRVQDIRQIYAEVQSFTPYFSKIGYSLDHQKGVLLSMSHLLQQQHHMMSNIGSKLQQVDKWLGSTKSRLALQQQQIEILMTQQMQLARTMLERQQIVVRSCQLLHHEMHLVSALV